jgi:site-specific DNA-methyltransferase (adenine-specific)
MSTPLLPARVPLPLDTVVHCDALTFLRGLPDNSIDLIVTDPPYGHNNNDKGDLIQRWEAALVRTRGAGLSRRPIANDGLEANDLFRDFLKEARRVLKPGCCCCCCGGGGPDPQFARWSMWMDEALQFKQMVVWDKGPMGMGWHYRRSYETILVAEKPGAKCRWYDTSHAIENIIRPGMNAPKIIPRANQHPTEKPVGLFEFFIRLHTQVGDVVLDPFAGSGSSLVAAQKMGRRFLGCELSGEWVSMARERLAAPYTLPMFDMIGASA